MDTTLNSHIESTPGYRGGRPRIAGTRLAVADIVILHYRLDQPLEIIAGKYDVPLSALHAALAHYHDHQAEIDRSIEEDEAFVEAFRRNNPSLLQAKLQSLKNA